MTKEELIQLSNDTFFDNDEGAILPSAHRAFNEALIKAIFPDLTLVKVPVGFNMRGKTIMFLNPGLSPYDSHYFELKFGDNSVIEHDGGYIAISIIGGAYTYIHGGNGWELTSFTFPNDKDYIVMSNSLPVGTGIYWGWDSAIIKD